MEPLALIAIGSSVLALSVIGYRALRPNQFHSPVPFTLDIDKASAFNSLLRVLQSNKSQTFEWKVMEAVQDAYIIANLKFVDQSNRHIRVDGRIQFDLSTPKPGCTSIRWNGEYSHWCDRKTMSLVEGFVSDWVALKLCPPKVEPPKPERIDWRSESTTVECRQPIAIVYAKLHSRLENFSSPFEDWLINSAVENESIDAEHRLKQLRYYKPPVITQIVNVKFRFETTDHNHCSVTWIYSCDNLPWQEIESMHNICIPTSEWIQLVLGA